MIASSRQGGATAISGNLRVAFAASLLAAACASTPAAVSTKADDASVDKSLRVLGRENDVRIEARVLTTQLRQAGSVGIDYEIENLRSEPIAFAAVEATVDYEPSSRTLMIGIGSEIPLESAVPHLVRIAPGETKAFTTGARIAVSAGASRRYGPRFLQVRLNYLDPAEPFEPLIASGAAAGVDEDGLFRNWIDHIASVVTNALPIRWGAGDAMLAVSAAQRAPVALP